MVRTYKSKGTRKQHTQVLLDQAMEMLRKGSSVLKVSKELKIQRNFLIRYIKKHALNRPVQFVRPSSPPVANIN